MLVRSAATIGMAGGVAFAYGTLVERNAFVLREFSVPVLAPGSAPLRLLHITDLHLLPRQRRKQAWIRDLATTAPDLVINTGDTLSALDGIPAVMHALAPLLAFPGAFVPGNNDYFAPLPKNPMRYFFPSTNHVYGARLPWPQLATALTHAGWTDLTHRRVTLDVGGRPVFLAGTDDPHSRRADYARIAGTPPAAATVRIGVTHSPEPRLLHLFARDGYDLVLAGHTHGGQVRVPFGPAIVTNCGIDRGRARWLHRWDDGRMWFHVCAGLGTNPYSAIRFACRPEATLLTLTPQAPDAGRTAAVSASSAASVSPAPAASEAG